VTIVALDVADVARIEVRGLRLRTGSEHPDLRPAFDVALGCQCSSRSSQGRGVTSDAAIDLLARKFALSATSTVQPAVSAGRVGLLVQWLIVCSGRI